MKKGRNWIRIVIVLVVVAGTVSLVAIKLAGNKKKINENNQVVDRSMIAVPVTVVNASRQPVSGSFSLPAVIEPETEADITLNTAGKIRNLNFRLGSLVRKGEVLGSLDNSLKEINLQSAELMLEKAKKDFERVDALRQGNAATEIDFLNAKYAYENAQTQVALIRQQIADGTLVAPISGIITRKNMEPGEFVNMGMAVATIVDIQNLKARVMVGESNVYRVTSGMKVSLTTDIYPGKTFTGTVRYVSPKGDESHNYEVEVTVQNDKTAPLKGGTFVRVQFDLDEGAPVLQVPKMALVEGVKNPYVYVIRNNKAEQRAIVTGREVGENIEVLDGLQEGESVVTSGHINLSDGKIVEVVNLK